MTREFWPHTVYVTRDAEHDLLTERVLSRLGDVQVIPLEERIDPLTQSHHDEPEDETFTRGKRSLLLTRHRGGWLESCPGTKDHVCCNLWIVNPGEGCPLDCTYCYLQSYLRRNPTMKLFTNTGEMLSAIEEKATSQPNRLFRVCTGELMDSLVWDDLTDLTLELVPLFARIPNLSLELKTKYTNIDNLLKLADEHDGKTVVSWSMNAATVSKSDEAFTASIDERLAAAKRLIDAGYRVGFHLDPLVHFQGWQDEYRDLVRKIFSEIDVADVAWVSVSTLRYRREMQQTMQRRFPQSKIPFGEQLLARDNKLRYAQPIRLKMVNFVWRELKSISEAMPVYMCMESAAAWRYVAGGPPAAGSELVEIFSRRGRLPIVENSVAS